MIRRLALAFALAAAPLAVASFADPAKVLRVSMLVSTLAWIVFVLSSTVCVPV